MTETQRWLIVVSVMLATILEILDSTIVSIALPHMMGTFGATPDQITWVLTSYIVAAAVIMPLSGFLIHRLGSKKLLLINIIGFLTASILCGAANTLLEMVFFRILQGIFGASLVPLSQFILRNTFAPEQLTKAMAIWGVGIMAGPILGPTIGGYITESFNWRWIFYINVPICLLDVFMCLKFVPETPIAAIKIDKYGIFLLVLTIACLQFFLDRGNSVNWFDAWSIRWSFSIFVIGFVLFMIHSLTYPAPVINLRLFLNRNFSLGCLLISLFMAGAIGIISLQPLLMENLLNYPPDYSGLVMAPRGIASGIMMGCVPLLMKIKVINEKILAVSGVILGIVSAYLFSGLTLQVNPAFFMWAGFIQGLGIGLFFVPLSRIAFLGLSHDDYAEASGIFSFCRSLGMSVGISLLGTLLSRENQINWNSLIGHINYFNPVLKYLPINLQNLLTLAKLKGQIASQSSLLSFLDAYYAVTAGFIILLPLTLLLKTEKVKSF